MAQHPRNLYRSSLITLFPVSISNHSGDLIKASKVYPRSKELNLTTSWLHIIQNFISKVNSKNASIPGNCLKKEKLHFIIKVFYLYYKIKWIPMPPSWIKILETFSNQNDLKIIKFHNCSTARKQERTWDFSN